MEGTLGIINKRLAVIFRYGSLVVFTPVAAVDVPPYFLISVGPWQRS